MMTLLPGEIVHRIEFILNHKLTANNIKAELVIDPIMNKNQVSLLSNNKLIAEIPYKEIATDPYQCYPYLVENYPELFL